MSETSERHQRVMVIAAHPDDPEFGCAGTVAKWAQEGKHITYLLLTSGDKGSRDLPMRAGEVAAKREKEQRDAASELGVADIIFLHHPDGLVENNMALRRELCWYIRQHEPEVIMAIDPWRRYQLHPDHRAAGQAALDAIYAAREWNIFPEQILGDGPWRVKEAYLFWTDSADHWEDISCCVEGRIAALSRHTSQVGHRVETLGDRIREGARKVGEDHGLEYAEAFKRLKF